MNLKIKVTPRAKKTEFIGILSDGTYKIRLKVVPEKGKANAELIRFLAEVGKVSKDEVILLSGSTDSRKLVQVPDFIEWPPEL